MSSQSRLLGNSGQHWGGSRQGYCCDVLLGERLVQQPRYYGEVAALIVGREEDRVFVFLGWRHCEVVLRIGETSDCS
jgi:hypothetical protein